MVVLSNFFLPAFVLQAAFIFITLLLLMSLLSSNWAKLQKKQQFATPSKVTKKSKVSPPGNKKKLTKTKKITENIETQQSNSTDTSSDTKVVFSDSAETKTKAFSKSIIKLHDDNDNDKINQRKQEIGKYLAIDCEFVGVGPDAEISELARVSIVNFHGITVLDTFVKPTEKVTDWRTWVSGVTPKDMIDAITFKDAQQRVSDLIDSRILVGHAIDHDLEALMLSHPRSMIRDTAKHLPFKKQYAMGKTPSLKKLTKEILCLDIQSAEHSSVEDAKATMEIYKSDKKEFEKLHKLKFKPKIEHRSR